jgi:hypothetical protein
MKRKENFLEMGKKFLYDTKTKKGFAQQTFAKKRLQKVIFPLTQLVFFFWNYSYLNELILLWGLKKHLCQSLEFLDQFYSMLDFFLYRNLITYSTVVMTFFSDVFFSILKGL